MTTMLVQWHDGYELVVACPGFYTSSAATGAGGASTAERIGDRGGGAAQGYGGLVLLLERRHARLERSSVVLDRRRRARRVDGLVRTGHAASGRHRQRDGRRASDLLGGAPGSMAWSGAGGQAPAESPRRGRLHRSEARCSIRAARCCSWCWRSGSSPACASRKRLAALVVLYALAIAAGGLPRPADRTPPGGQAWPSIRAPPERAPAD